MKRLFLLFFLAVLAGAGGFVFRFKGELLPVSLIMSDTNVGFGKPATTSCDELAYLIGQSTLSRNERLEALEDSFVKQCPETVRVFPFKKTFFLLGDKGVEEAWLTHGLLVRANGTIGHLIRAEADELVVRFAKKEDLVLEQKNGIFMPKEHVIYVQHPNWTDSVLIEGKRFIRLAGNAGDIISQTPRKIKVKWDYWGYETFVFKNGIWQVNP